VSYPHPRRAEHRVVDARTGWPNATKGDKAIRRTPARNCYHRVPISPDRFGVGPVGSGRHGRLDGRPMGTLRSTKLHGLSEFQGSDHEYRPADGGRSGSTNMVLVPGVLADHTSGAPWWRNRRVRDTDARADPAAAWKADSNVRDAFSSRGVRCGQSERFSGVGSGPMLLIGQIPACGHIVAIPTEVTAPVYIGRFRSDAQKMAAGSRCAGFPGSGLGPDTTTAGAARAGTISTSQRPTPVPEHST
jgi:hypothetical protein